MILMKQQSRTNCEYMIFVIEVRFRETFPDMGSLRITQRDRTRS
jgi:hypothetical protein